MIRIGGDKRSYYLVLLASLLLVSCDPAKVLIIENGISKEVDFACGAVEVYGVSGLGPEYQISFFLEAKDTVFITMDSLKVFRKEDPIKYDYTINQYGQDTVLSENVIEPKAKRIIRLSISKYAVNYGDTLLVKPSSFIQCRNGESSFYDPIRVILRGVKP